MSGVEGAEREDHDDGQAGVEPPMRFNRAHACPSPPAYAYSVGRVPSDLYVVDGPEMGGRDLGLTAKFRPVK